MKYIQGVFELIKKEKLSDTVFDFTVLAPEIAQKATAGQFVNILCDAKTLRRPISICEIDSKASTLRIVFEIRGEGTSWLSQQSVGSKLDIMGPLGRPFTEGLNGKKCIVVGGGIGVPPMLGISHEFENVDAVLGFRSKGNMILLDDFNKSCNNVFVATDDGSYGHYGNVGDLLKDKINDCDVVFACGPTPMLKAVSEIAERNSKLCYVSLEQRMGCGIGACLVCACKTKDNGGEHYRHVCKHGPIFDSREVEW